MTSLDCPTFLRAQKSATGCFPTLCLNKISGGLTWLIAALQDDVALSKVPINGLDALAEVVPTVRANAKDEITEAQLAKIAELLGLEEEPGSED